MQYRRAKNPGATYFFTVVTYQRQKIFHISETVDLLRTAFRTVKSKFPFTIDAKGMLCSNEVRLIINFAIKC